MAPERSCRNNLVEKKELSNHDDMLKNMHGKFEQNRKYEWTEISLIYKHLKRMGVSKKKKEDMHTIHTFNDKRHG